MKYNIHRVGIPVIVVMMSLLILAFERGKENAPIKTPTAVVSKPVSEWAAEKGVRDSKQAHALPDRDVKEFGERHIGWDVIEDIWIKATKGRTLSFKETRKRLARLKAYMQKNKHRLNRELRTVICECLNEPDCLGDYIYVIEEKTNTGTAVAVPEQIGKSRP